MSVDSQPTRSAPTRKSSARGRAAAGRILEVAKRAFAERGYRGASLNEIARNSGLSMPGLLHHFASKEELFAAVLRDHEAQDEVLFTSIVPDEPDLFQILDAFTEMARINIGRYSLVQFTHLIAAESAPGDHPATDVVRGHFRRARDFVESACRRSIERGDVSPDVDVQVIGLRVVAMVEGLQNQWLLEPDAFDYAEVFAGWAAEFKSTVVS